MGLGSGSLAAFPPSVNILVYSPAMLEERLNEGKVPYELFWYDAKHAFANPNPPGSAGLGHYDSAAAQLSWERAVRFWKNTLH